MALDFTVIVQWTHPQKYRTIQLLRLILFWPLFFILMFGQLLEEIAPRFEEGFNVLNSILVTFLRHQDQYIN